MLFHLPHIDDCDNVYDGMLQLLRCRVLFIVIVGLLLVLMW